MKLYLNELAPWERKSEYLHHVQLGKNVKLQTAILKDAIQNNTKAQLVSATTIIASQQRLNEGIADLNQGMVRIEDGLEGLRSTLEWGISEVIWQIEQNREVLKSIIEVLMAPLNTQAKERRRRAEEAYANGWIEDAEDEFLESEKLNKFDFSIHISLGMTYLFHLVDKEKALEYFIKAEKYARPKSDYYTSFALLYQALIKRDTGHLAEAERLSSEAIRISPDLVEAKYQNAQYNALLGNTAKAVSRLKESIIVDKNYCLKACNDLAFDGIRNEVEALLKDLRALTKSKVEHILGRINKSLINFKEFASRLSNTINITLDSENLERTLDKVTRLLERNSYFDGLDALALLAGLQEQPKNLYESIMAQLKSSESQCKSKIDDIKNNAIRKTESSLSLFRNIIIGGIAAGILLGIVIYFSELSKGRDIGQHPISAAIMWGSVLMLTAYKVIKGPVINSSRNHTNKETNRLEEKIAAIKEWQSQLQIDFDANY